MEEVVVRFMNDATQVLCKWDRIYRWLCCNAVLFNGYHIMGIWLGRNTVFLKLRLQLVMIFIIFMIDLVNKMSDNGEKLSTPQGDILKYLVCTTKSPKPKKLNKLLYLIKETLKSSHLRNWKNVWPFCLKSYLSIIKLVSDYLLSIS